MRDLCVFEVTTGGLKQLVPDLIANPTLDCATKSIGETLVFLSTKNTGKFKFTWKKEGASSWYAWENSKPTQITLKGLDYTNGLLLTSGSYTDFTIAYKLKVGSTNVPEAKLKLDSFCRQCTEFTQAGELEGRVILQPPDRQLSDFIKDVSFVSMTVGLFLGVILTLTAVKLLRRG
jgi:hypothetical protein